MALPQTLSLELRTLFRQLRALRLLIGMELGSIRPQYQAVDMQIIFQRVLQRFEQQIRLRNIQIIVPTEFPCVIGNPILLEEAIDHLISNAIKYMNTPNPCIQILVDTTEDSETYHIIDNGRGISDQDLPYIFDWFYRGFHTDFPKDNIN